MKTKNRKEGREAGTGGREREADAGGAKTEQAYRVRLPGFNADQELGLGDIIKRLTTAAGIKPCGGCRRRADALNHRLVFSGRRSK